MQTHAGNLTYLPSITLHLPVVQRFRRVAIRPLDVTLSLVAAELGVILSVRSESSGHVAKRIACVQVVSGRYRCCLLMVWCGNRECRKRDSATSMKCTRHNQASISTPVVKTQESHCTPHRSCHPDKICVFKPQLKAFQTQRTKQESTDTNTYQQNQRIH